MGSREKRRAEAFALLRECYRPASEFACRLVRWLVISRLFEIPVSLTPSVHRSVNRIDV